MDSKKLADALKVLVLAKATKAHLMEHDPQALKQALDALEVPAIDPKAIDFAAKVAGLDRLKIELEARTELLADQVRAASLAELLAEMSAHKCEPCGACYASDDFVVKCKANGHYGRPVRVARN